jgi:hypothetical protein
MSRDPLHGRGARTNAGGRYERFVAEAFDDGWTPEEVRPLETIVTPELAKSIISTNASPDISFEQSINPYRGCEHGCIYCECGGAVGSGIRQALVSPEDDHARRRH